MSVGQYCSNTKVLRKGKHISNVCGLICNFSLVYDILFISFKILTFSLFISTCTPVRYHLKYVKSGSSELTPV